MWWVRIACERAVSASRLFLVNKLFAETARSQAMRTQD